MQVRCVKAFGEKVPGDLADVPDGAVFDPEHWEPAAPAPVQPPLPAVPVITPEGM